MTSWPSFQVCQQAHQSPVRSMRCVSSPASSSMVIPSAPLATNTTPGGPGRQLADLELRHRRRARAEDRIRTAKDTGLRNLPLHELDQNRIWCAVVALACELTAWAQLLAFAEHPARRWEPKRLRLRIFSLAGRLTRSGRRTVLHLAGHAPWAALLLQAVITLRALPAPG